MRNSEPPIDETVPFDIWGAQEYLSDSDTKIDYARERLKNSQDILQRTHALLNVPKKCTYEIVESTDELTNVKVEHNDETKLPAQSLNKTSGKVKEIFQPQIIGLEEVNNYEEVEFDKEDGLAIETTLDQFEKSVVNYDDNNMLPTGRENDEEYSLSYDCMDNFMPSKEQRLSNESLGEYSKDLNIENSPKTFPESVPIKSSTDDQNIDTVSEHTECCIGEFENVSDITNLIQHQSNTNIPVHKTFEIMPMRKQNYFEQNLNFKQEIATDLVPELNCLITKNEPQDMCSQYFQSEPIAKEAECSQIGKSASTTGFNNSETKKDHIPQGNFAMDDLMTHFVGSSKKSQNIAEKLDTGHDIKNPKPLVSIIHSNFYKSIWDTLPNEIILLIFSFLNQRDLKQIALVCHRFYALAKDHCLWSKLDIESTDVTSLLLDNFTRVRQVNMTRSKAKNLTNKSLRVFFQNSKDTLKTIHLSHCSDKYLCGDNVLLHIATHCRKVNSISLPWSNTTDNGIDALTMSNLMLSYLDISGNCFISDGSFVNLLQKSGAILETLKVNGCFALTQNSFVAIADNCINISVLDIGLCPKIGKESIILISSALKNLREFDLRGLNAVDDYCLSCIAKNCKLLAKLVLANCKSLSDNGISNLGYDLPNLTSLDLSGCSSITDDGCCNLAHALINASYLDFSSTSISYVSLFAFTENFYHSLQCLKISFCNNITHDSVERLVSFCFKLNTLHVHGCKRIDVKKLQKNHATLLINK